MPPRWRHPRPWTANLPIGRIRFATAESGVPGQIHATAESGVPGGNGIPFDYTRSKRPYKPRQVADFNVESNSYNRYLDCADF